MRKSSLEALARSSFALSLATLMALAHPASARGPRMVDGNQAQQRVFKLSTEIEWHKDLNETLRQAQREGKLVFWVHMLGQIDGAT